MRAINQENTYILNTDVVNAVKENMEADQICNLQKVLSKNIIITQCVLFCRQKSLCDFLLLYVWSGYGNSKGTTKERIWRAAGCLD